MRRMRNLMLFKEHDVKWAQVVWLSLVPYIIQLPNARVRQNKQQQLQEQQDTDTFVYLV